MAWEAHEELKPKKDRSARYKIMYAHKYGLLKDEMIEDLIDSGEITEKEVVDLGLAGYLARYRYLKPRPVKNNLSLDVSKNMKSDNIAFKYNEESLLNELREYIDSTYHQHYVGDNNVQSLDLIFSSGKGVGFCAGNILKYAARYGKKDGESRKDILKIAHYALLLLYLNDLGQDK